MPYTFTRTSSQVRRRYQLVTVEVAKLDRGLARDSYYVGKGGKGQSAVAGRYAEAKSFLARARVAGTKIEAIEGGVDRRGRPFIDDGRHRFAALRDSGIKTIEVAVPRGQAGRVEALFGPPPVRPPSAVPSGDDPPRRSPFNQPLAGRVEPTAPSWRRATPSDRLAFYREAGRRAVEVKRGELSRAIGANGRRMKPRKHPRPDGANGPVMTPHDEESRTARLLAARATAGGVTLFWHGGLTKALCKPWGAILGYHADGKVRGAPARDVRLSARGVNQVRAEMAAWWLARQRAETRKANAAEATFPARKFGTAFGRVVNAARARIDAMVGRYSGLAPYLKPKDGGF